MESLNAMVRSGAARHCPSWLAALQDRPQRAFCGCHRPIDPCCLPAACPHPRLQVNYCEEQVECRRVLMLTHFGETGFARAQCRSTCDNCRATEGQVLVEEDVSEAAKKGGWSKGRVV